MGQTLLFNRRATQVVGVVADTRANIDKNAPPVAYVPYWSTVLGNDSHLTVAIRPTLAPGRVAAILRQTVSSIDAEVPVSNVQTLGNLKSDATAGQRFQLTLIAVFAGAALLVASLGIFGVIAGIVTARRNEIGIRMAFGATSAGIVQLVVRQGMVPVGLGIMGGIVTTIACGALIQSLLYEVSAADPMTVCSVVGLLLVVAALACWIPARRASRIDPVEALHYQ